METKKLEESESYKGNCLHSICLHESGCKPSGCRMDNGTLSCGYYQINKAYYEDCGQPGGKGEEAWKECSDDYNCATTCVQA
uniref:lysozyme n=1 Tax=Plectus sambesii TaxID=2011161 RepID=A0A914W8N9_9BILA